jgi:hypothetical protein
MKQSRLTEAQIIGLLNEHPERHEAATGPRHRHDFTALVNSTFPNVPMILHWGKPNGLCTARSRDGELRVTPRGRDVSAKTKPT